MRDDASLMRGLLKKGAGSIDLQIIDGGTTMTIGEGGSSEVAVRQAYDTLQSSIARKEDDLKKYQMQSTVRSPVLNYWNNKWTL